MEAPADPYSLWIAVAHKGGKRGYVAVREVVIVILLHLLISPCSCYLYEKMHTSEYMFLRSCAKPKLSMIPRRVALWMTKYASHWSPTMFLRTT